MKRAPEPLPIDNPVARAMAPVARFLTALCGWWLMAYAVLTCADILARKLLNRSIQGVDEIGGYTLAVVGALSFAWPLIQRSHTRVDFLLGRFGPDTRAVLNVLAYASLAALGVMAAWMAWDVVADSLRYRSRSTTPLQTPLWIPQALWLFGLAVFAVTAVGLAVHASFLLVRDRKAVNRLYGPLTVEEEINTETAGLMERGLKRKTP
jgi:TRAP-type mannitol/chloroaromatic compound transport system permease small subunit